MHATEQAGSKANSMDRKTIVVPATECLHCKSSLTHVSTPLFNSMSMRNVG